MSCDPWLGGKTEKSFCAIYSAVCQNILSHWSCKFGHEAQRFSSAVVLLSSLEAPKKL